MKLFLGHTQLSDHGQFFSRGSIDNEILTKPLIPGFGAWSIPDSSKAEVLRQSGAHHFTRPLRQKATIALGTGVVRQAKGGS